MPVRNTYMIASKALRSSLRMRRRCWDQRLHFLPHLLTHFPRSRSCQCSFLSFVFPSFYHISPGFRISSKCLSENQGKCGRIGKKPTTRREMPRTRPWEVSEDLWERVKPLIPEPPSHAKGGRPRMEDRKAFEAIVYILRTGRQWNALPRELAAS